MSNQLAICIGKKILLDNTLHNGDKSNGQIPDENKYADDQYQDPMHEASLDGKMESSLRSDAHHEKDNVSSVVDPNYAMKSADQQKVNTLRRGSASILESMTLLHSFQKMHVPYTQEAPPMTEDMHEERLCAIEAFGDAFTCQLSKLQTWMQFLKISFRWHSPSDWESDESEDRLRDDKMELNHNWPPRGRLSQRMSEHGNSWRRIWNDSPALPASEQKPLFDPIREWAKTLRYLETLRPHHLFAQMVSTGFRGSADTLNQATFGDLKLMKTKVDQLYLTLASPLRQLQENHLPEKAELIGDLMQLCRVFEQIEKLVILASSVHCKLLDAPRLSEALFNDYFNLYLPKMGTSSASICYDKEFNTKQLVKMHGRDVVASLFPLLPQLINRGGKS